MCTNIRLTLVQRSSGISVKHARKQIVEAQLFPGHLPVQEQSHHLELQNGIYFSNENGYFLYKRKNL